ncbi:MAG: major capsid protein, partial [Sphingomicrobium sp.]
ARFAAPAPAAEPTPAPVAAPTPAPAAVTAAPAPARVDAVLPPLPAAPTNARPAPIQGEWSIIAAAGLDNVAPGSNLASLTDVARVLADRRRTMGANSPGNPDDRVIVASIHSGLPAERRLESSDIISATHPRIRAVTSPEAITAAGGLCAPVTPYYPIMTLATASRPVRDSMAVFSAARGGIRYVAPPQISDPAAAARVTSADGVTTNGSATITSATANFQAYDIGGTVTGSITGIPAGAVIVAVASPTSATISANATATTASNIFTITRPGAIGYITAAVDAAAQGGTTLQQVSAYKPCLHVTCPGITEIDVAAISRCVEFGNLTARAYPEQVEAWIQIALAQWARRAETALLDRMSSSSTQVTAAAVLGAARQLVAQVVKAGSYFRNRNRMDRDTPLHVWLPSWVIDLAITDLVFGSGYETEFYSMARQQFTEALAQGNVNVSWYLDSGTGKGQYINSGNRQAAGALTAFPTTVVWYLAAEGSWLFLDDGTLDIGLVRDSTLNQSNNYRIFGESFEEAALIGPESLEVTSTISATGAYAPAGSAPSGF